MDGNLRLMGIGFSMSGDGAGVPVLFAICVGLFLVIIYMIMAMFLYSIVHLFGWLSFSWMNALYLMIIMIVSGMYVGWMLEGRKRD